MKSLFELDFAVADAVAAEERRQAFGLEMIASENYTSRGVLLCQGSVLTNKYAEGYPGRRYYGGCAEVDRVEQLAIERAKQVFAAEHVNVQPHSGASANIAVFIAFLQPGDVILGMDLAHGGHLTHGSPVNFSGKMYRVVHYGVDQNTQQIDYAQMRRLAAYHLSRESAGGHPGGTVNELLTVYTIVNALTANLPAVTTVQLLVDGREVDTLAGHVDLRRPLAKNLSYVQ